MKKADVKTTIEILKEQFPKAKIALNFSGNWQLLVAVVLSAQCTDERVNMVTPALFKRFPEVEDFANCEITELEKMIYSTGFYKNKAKNIQGAAKKIMKDFGGNVPDNMKQLLSLPGVARKTANVVLYSGFGKVEGIVVDTHVARITGRLGWVSKDLSEGKKAVQIEKKLMKIIPKENWGEIAHLLILHGRKTCIARNPRCQNCELKRICPSAKKFLK